MHARPNPTLLQTTFPIQAEVCCSSPALRQGTQVLQGSQTTTHDRSLRNKAALAHFEVADQMSRAQAPPKCEGYQDLKRLQNVEGKEELARNEKEQGQEALARHFQENCA